MAHLRLEFHRGHELAFGDYNEVPLLLRAVITRQLQRRAGFDIEFLQTGIAKNVCNQNFHGAHLRSAGDFATSAGVDLAADYLLFLVSCASVPVALGRLVQFLIDVQALSPFQICECRKFRELPALRVAGRVCGTLQSVPLPERARAFWDLERECDAGIVLGIGDTRLACGHRRIRQRIAQWQTSGVRPEPQDPSHPIG